MQGRRSFLRQAVILWAAGLVGAVAVFPFVLHMQSATLEKANAKGLTVPVLVAALIIQNGVLLTIAVPVGLWAANRLSLRAPPSEALATGGSLPEATKPLLRPAILAGVVTGVLLWLLLAFVFLPAAPTEFTTVRRSITWQGLSAALFGGITEELLFRLFLLGVVALGLRWLLAPAATGLPAAPFWVANSFAALCFGLGHIPGQLNIGPLTPAVWAEEALARS